MRAREIPLLILGHLYNARLYFKDENITAFLVSSRQAIFAANSLLRKGKNSSSPSSLPFSPNKISSSFVILALDCIALQLQKSLSRNVYYRSTFTSSFIKAVEEISSDLYVLLAHVEFSYPSLQKITQSATQTQTPHHLASPFFCSNAPRVTHYQQGEVCV